MMRHIHLGGRAAVSNSALLVVTLVVGLSACGGSSGSSSTDKTLTGSRLSGATASPAKAAEEKSKALKSRSSKPPGPKQVARLSQFAACMRKHGVQLPAPKVSASGARLDYEAVNTASAKYKRALSACARQLAPNLLDRHGKVKINTIQIPGLHIHIKDIHIKGVKRVPAPSVPAPSVPGGGSTGSTPPYGEGSPPSKQEGSNTP